MADAQLMESVLPTSVVRFPFRGRGYFVKRDDLIDPLLSGNKYRKLCGLIQMPADRYSGLISFGGTQSNAMLSMAALCKLKGWQFHYTVKTVPPRLKESPSGNLKMALELGMQLHEVSPDAYAEATAALCEHHDAASLFVPQGGADPLAEAGVEALAREIDLWRKEQAVEGLTVVTPSGTGTTAFYLARALPRITVVTTALVGDAGYLLRQMRMLGGIPDNLKILEDEKKRPFARPDPELLATWQALQAAGIEFDLIYGARMWHVLLMHADAIEDEILYVHSGGLPGNATMLDRYRHLGMVS